MPAFWEYPQPPATPWFRASKTFVLFVLSTEAETGYFGGRKAVKGEESNIA